MENKEKSSLHKIFLNFNRICYLAKNGIISENKIKEEMGELMLNIWNNYSTREMCELVTNPENITYYRKFVKENLQI
ncbi:MAG: hypothetical protein QXF32_01445 [Candidatus Thermoplasmatota archaeon]